MYKYLFGPVPSRRLGMSLGVDLLPLKTCTLNCIYCECGPTTNLTLERREWVPIQKVIQELDDYFTSHPLPDFVTFAGSGEPLLNTGIGKIIFHLKRELQLPVKIAILTNGTLLSVDDVQEQLSAADLVIPSLDAATVKAFKNINHPHPSLQLEEIKKGLKKFKSSFAGELWIEVFIVPGINTAQEELLALKESIQIIAPNKVQLNTLDRPGVIRDLQPASKEELEQIVNFLDLPEVEVIARQRTRKDNSAYRKDWEAAILETIERRPCTLEDLRAILGLHLNEINKYLSELSESGQICCQVQPRGIFYYLSRT